MRHVTRKEMEEFKEQQQNPIDQENAELWERYIESYDIFFTNLESYNKLLNIHKEALLEKNIILDSCAGSGRLSIELLNEGKEVIAIDQNETGLEMLKKNAKNLSEKLTTYVCDANYLPINNESVDGISSMLAISFMNDPEQYLKENFRVLKQGGTIVISGPSKEASNTSGIFNGWYSELKKAGKDTELDIDMEKVFKKSKEIIEKFGFKWFSKEELCKLLEEIGFKKIKVKENPLYYGRGYVIIAEK